jgi:hypothetical protein
MHYTSEHIQILHFIKCASVFSMIETKVSTWLTQNAAMGLDT